MRICFVIPTYPTFHARTGSAVYTQQVARGMARLGHDVHVVCIGQYGTGSTETDEGVSVHLVPPQRLRIRRALGMLARVPGLQNLGDVRCGWGLVEMSLGAWLKVARLHLRQRFDLIHAVDTGGIALFGVLWPGRRMPIVIRGHGFVDPQLPGMQWCGALFHHWLERFCLRKADHVLTNSRYLRDVYRSRFGLADGRVSVLYTGFPMPQPPRIALDVRQTQGWEAGDPIVLFVGRIEYLKGCDLLFAALLCARQQDPRLRLVLLGEVQPSFQPEFQAFMAGNEHWVWQPGNVTADEVSRIMHQASMVVLPSRKETFGRVLVEAQLHGLPVVGADVGGIPEIVTHNDTGLLVQSEDMEGLTQAILRLAGDGAYSQRVGRQAFASASRRFGFRNIIQQQVTLYAGFVRNGVFKA